MFMLWFLTRYLTVSLSKLTCYLFGKRPQLLLSLGPTQWGSKLREKRLTVKREEFTLTVPLSSYRMGNSVYNHWFSRNSEGSISAKTNWNKLISSQSILVRYLYLIERICNFTSLSLYNLHVQVFVQMRREEKENQQGKPFAGAHPSLLLLKGAAPLAANDTVHQRLRNFAFRQLFASQEEAADNLRHLISPEPRETTHI